MRAASFQQSAIRSQHGSIRAACGHPDVRLVTTGTGNRLTGQRPANQRAEQERGELDEQHDEEQHANRRADEGQPKGVPITSTSPATISAGKTAAISAPPTDPAFRPPTNPAMNGPNGGIQNSRMPSPSIHKDAEPTEPCRGAVAAICNPFPGVSV
jgi:hypothetical protein